MMKVAPLKINWQRLISAQQNIIRYYPPVWMFQKTNSFEVAFCFRCNFGLASRYFYLITKHLARKVTKYTEKR